MIRRAAGVVTALTLVLGTAEQGGARLGGAGPGRAGHGVARHGEARHGAGNPRALLKAFNCIARHEAPGQRGEIAWAAIDRTQTYYGGLQMDIPFQRYWGREFYRAWGTADHWPKEVQIAVAIRAYFHRGFAPWPTTSRICGLR